VEVDWTTFLLEIVNFLVLVWILSRLLYKPVLKTIADRQAEIRNTVSEAERLRNEAQALREEYEQRQARWREEKEAARNRMLEEVNAERGRLLAELQSSLKAEREKAGALEQQRVTDLARQAEDKAAEQAGLFAARLLTRLANAELEARLLEVVIDDLGRLPEARRQAIRTAATTADAPIVVSSAHALNQSQRDSLMKAIEPLLGRTMRMEWREDPQLVAGVRISLGPWMLAGNLQDELKFLSEALRSGDAAHGS
jgi:F-type H+-transporting ATPase subunit b